MSTSIVGLESLSSQIIEARVALVCIFFPWSPSSLQLKRACDEVRSELAQLGVSIFFVDGDTALDFCARNGICAGAGGLKAFDGGREVCFKRPQAQASSYTLIGQFRGTQVKECAQAFLDSKKTESIPQLNW